MRENLNDRVFTSFSSPSGRSRRPTAPCYVDTVPPHTVLSTTINCSGLETPPPSACGQRLHSDCSSSSPEQSESAGPSGVAFRSQSGPVSVYDKWMEDAADCLTLEAGEYKDKLNMVSLPFRLPNAPNEPFIYGFDNSSPEMSFNLSDVYQDDSSYLGACSINTASGLQFQGLDDTWQSAGFYSHPKRFGELSFAGPLFTASNPEQLDTTCSSLDSTIDSLPTPSASSFCSSAPGSAFGTHFEVEHHTPNGTSIVPSRAFADDPCIFQSMISYGARRELATPSPKADSILTGLMDISRLAESPSPSPLKGKSSSGIDKVYKRSVRKSKRSSRLQSSDESECRRRPKINIPTSYTIQTKEGSTLEFNIDRGIEVGETKLLTISPDETEKPRPCLHLYEDGSRCERVFKRAEHLKRHLLKHTKVRPFPCIYPYCHKSKPSHACGRHDNWVDHIASHTKAYIKREIELRSRSRNGITSPHETEEALWLHRGEKEALATMKSIRSRMEKDKDFRDNPRFAELRQRFHWLA